MNNPLSFESSSASKSWSPGEITTPEPDGQDRLLGWWYNLTAFPEPPANASFVRREAVRRGRLFSTVTFFFLIVLIIFFPACLFLPNHLVIYLDGILIGITVFTLVLNRMEKPFLAGLILVIASELVLTAVIVTTIPFDETSIQLYDLYLVVDLLAVSLIPPQSIFPLALCNSLFIYLDLVYQPNTAVLAHDLTTQLIPVVIRPVGLQIIIAGVAYLWVRSATRAITRADRAEMVAALEHTIAEERASFEMAKVQLEESIQQLVKTHAEAMNGQVIAKIPYTPEAKILWPLIGVINALWVRLQRAHQTEYELHQLKQAILTYTELLRQARLTPQRSLPMYRTKTELDSLIIALGNLYRPRSEH
ncbi:MAG TPA: hypothetical protein VFV38_00445 [Ktedonobacteraceae bacterium]|nr:hypothetical protein [Ktedonobacteraceae bacterium]